MIDLEFHISRKYIQASTVLSIFYVYFSAEPCNSLIKKIIMTLMGKEIVRYEITSQVHRL